MRIEELQRKIERAISFGLAVRLAAVPRKRVVGARVFVNLHQWIRRQPPLQQLVYFGLDPSVPHRHMQLEWTMKIADFTDVVLDIGAVIGDGAVDIRAAAHQVAKLAAEAVSNSADLTVAFGNAFEKRPGIFHIENTKVVVEIVIE